MILVSICRITPLRGAGMRKAPIGQTNTGTCLAVRALETIVGRQRGLAGELEMAGACDTKLPTRRSESPLRVAGFDLGGRPRCRQPPRCAEGTGARSFQPAGKHKPRIAARRSISRLP